MKKNIILSVLTLSSMMLAAQISPSADNKPWERIEENNLIINDINPEAKPAARWWWLGSAVDEKNITANLEEYASKGMGSLEITPIYGVQGNDSNDVQYLSDRWMELFKHTIAEGERLGIKIDMNAGTGWPFGGPTVSVEDAASKLILRSYNLTKGQYIDGDIVPEIEKERATSILERVVAFEKSGNKRKVIDLTSKVKDGKLNWKAPKGNWKVIASFCGKTGQKVKRAAPGGEGFVMDHFSKKAVDNYFSRFDKAFAESGAKFPHNFFNDSYEVYGASWTPGFFDEFMSRRGYDLALYLDVVGSDDNTEERRRIISDYRETIGDLLLENFTVKFRSWAESHGSQTRNQAHGSPGNLIDLYAAVSVPECEGFGISEFNINGLRVDSLKKKNDSDLTMLKYASSGAHISGKPFVSSETFTWLTEHFRTSLAQCKPDIDLMFLSGVNHTFFHGTPYSPLEAEWPGWQFYASINMSPTNSIWRDTKPFFDYITRCQSNLQKGVSDNDYLVYLPVYDMWHEQDGMLLMFDIHKMHQRAPEFIETVDKILSSGYDVDYISDNFIRGCKVENGEIVTKAGTGYKALVIPGAKKMPADVLAHINDMISQGANIAFLGHYPQDVPGYASLNDRRKEFKKELSKLPASDFKNAVSAKRGKGNVITGNDTEAMLDLCGGKKEVMKTEHNLGYIRRKVDKGYLYFISCLQGEDVKAWVPMGVTGQRVSFMNPLTGVSGLAKTRMNGDKQEVYFDLKSGQSVIVTSLDVPSRAASDWKYLEQAGSPIEINKGWKLNFVQSAPAIAEEFEIDTLTYWTNLDIPEAKVNMGTARYTTDFEFKKDSKHYILKLDNVRESARVIINGKQVGTLWSVPFECDVTEYLADGNNTIEIEVTNLPANRIADYDRRGIQWRKFKEINHVDLNYKKTGYGHWDVMESGLQGAVKLVPCVKK